MLYAIIMAGGAGTRFWPLSRAQTPKQLLDLTGGQTMIQATLSRLGNLVDPKQAWVITNERLVEPIIKQLPSLPAGNIVGEPCKRDTAPCIGLAALLVSQHDPEATMVVTPSDHLIGPDSVFQQALAAAAELVEKNPELFVTFGIKPTFPAETFGYIERAAPLAGSSKSLPTFHVARFREKPARTVAEEYLQAGTFYWNSGIFVWKAKTILAALEKFAPEIFGHLVKIRAALGQPHYAEVLGREFSAIVGKSIDYAVMEKYSQVAVIEAPFQWDDLGSWQALSRSLGTDKSGNTLVGKHLAIRTTGSIVRSTADHLVVTLGLTDCIVVHTPDATLVASKHDEEAIREVVKALQDQGRSEYL